MRRYAPLAKSRGTVIPPEVRIRVYQRDQGCVGPRVGMPGDCAGALSLDHVRASGALGKKSATEASNLVTLCNVGHHRMKTLEGRKWRPALLAYLERVS